MRGARPSRSSPGARSPFWSSPESPSELPPTSHAANAKPNRWNAAGKYAMALTECRCRVPCGPPAGMTEFSGSGPPMRWSCWWRPARVAAKVGSSSLYHLRVGPFIGAGCRTGASVSQRWVSGAGGGLVWITGQARLINLGRHWRRWLCVFCEHWHVT